METLDRKLKNPSSLQSIPAPSSQKGIQNYSCIMKVANENGTPGDLCELLSTSNVGRLGTLRPVQGMAIASLENILKDVGPHAAPNWISNTIEDLEPNELFTLTQYIE